MGSFAILVLLEAHVAMPIQIDLDQHLTKKQKDHILTALLLLIKVGIYVIFMS